MKNIYVYILETMADWELSYLIPQLNTGEFFKEGKEKFNIITVALTKQKLKSMGGITILPDITVDEMPITKETILLLPGATTWFEEKHNIILEKVKKILEIGGFIGAICGATAALANIGLLDNIEHTSNSLEYLNYITPNYSGENFYKNEKAVLSKNLVTASAAGNLLFAYYVLKYLDVFEDYILEEWYNYYLTGNFEHYYKLFETLQKK